MQRREDSLAVRASVPGGFSREGARVREMSLRPATGADEAFLLESAAGAAPSERASALLARCLALPDAAEVVRDLTVGDREALLLQLRRLTLGDEMECLVTCVGCGEYLEMLVRVSDLLVPPYDEVGGDDELSTTWGHVAYRVRFRPPTAKDLDAAARLARRAPEEGEEELLRRCVLEAEADGAEVAAGSLPPAVRDAVAAQMAARDPQAEVALELLCPSCSANFSVVLDAGGFLLQELESRAERLLREVHALALRYHWSEADILSMSAARRARYLDLLAATGARH